MITPRTTRLVRAIDLRGFRDALVSLALDGDPLGARDRLVLVPTRAAALHLTRTIEDTVFGTTAGTGVGEGAVQGAGSIGSRGPTIALPDVITPGELVGRLGDRLPFRTRTLSDAEREVLLGLSCREVRDRGIEPPFRLRPGLIAAILRFYDALRRHQSDVDTFERRALDALEPGASLDRGAERLVRQTHFLVAAFRSFEARTSEAGQDEHALRRRVCDEHAQRPYVHVIVAVGDHAFDPHGLHPADWDLLARVPGLLRLDVVVTDTSLAGAPHERMHHVLPGIEEVRFDTGEQVDVPALIVPASESSHGSVVTGEALRALVHVARDREEEVADFARRAKDHAREDGAPSLDRIALVVRQPLPYVYVAREVLRSAGVPCQMFDALPLASEPYAAALDLVLAAVAGGFARAPVVALLRSPHFDFSTVRQGGPNQPPPEATAVHRSFAAKVEGPPLRQRLRGDIGALEGPPVAVPEADELDHILRRGGPSGPPMSLSPRDVAALDRALAEAGYAGDLAVLARLVTTWRASEQGSRRLARAAHAGEILHAALQPLERLRTATPVAEHLTVLIDFMRAHEHLPGPEAYSERHLRARGAVLGTLGALRDAYARFDAALVDFDDIAALVRRWIEGQTFAPRTGNTGVHLIDADSARFGSFDHVQLAGLVDGEWPERPHRDIFYSSGVLRALGWPAESGRLDGARAAFLDLLGLPSQRLTLSSFSLESDAIVALSPLVDEVDAALFERLGSGLIAESPSSTPIFEYEALGGDAIDSSALTPAGQDWARFRREARARDESRFHGATTPSQAGTLSLTAIERYQDCPFKFFAADVLKLEEPPDDEWTLSPRARGQFIHEVFQTFFEAWDARGERDVSPERLDEARQLFAEVSAPLLARLPAGDAALERTRLFGSAISIGVVDIVLGLEASRPADVMDRWLEYRLEGAFSLGSSDGSVPLRGVADRVDLLTGRRLRVIDYKSGSAPNPKRALQAAIYALCAQERLEARDGEAWTIEEASYIALSGKRTLVPVVKGADAAGQEALAAARGRLVDVLAGIGRGEFPVRPFDTMICNYCAYSKVCRKDYVGDE